YHKLHYRVEEERKIYHEIVASEIRSRAGYLNPEIFIIMKSNFDQARTRIFDKYPRYYDYGTTFGLRISKTSSKIDPVLERYGKGVLERIGKIAPVSERKAEIKVNEFGMPIENQKIEISSQYLPKDPPKPFTDADVIGLEKVAPILTDSEKAYLTSN